MFQKSWKTSLAGFMAALFTVMPEINAWVASQPVNWRQVAVAFFLAFMGYMARDANVSSEAQGGKAAETAAKLPAPPDQVERR